MHIGPGEMVHPLHSVLSDQLPRFVFVREPAERVGINVGMGLSGLIKRDFSICHGVYLVRGLKEKIQMV